LQPGTVYARSLSFHQRYSRRLPACFGARQSWWHIELPLHLRPCMSGSIPACQRYFNPVQSEAFPAAFQSDNNLVVSAPTGTGKTGVMELAILRLLARQLDEHGHLHVKPGALKAVYLAPSRALVQVRPCALAGYCCHCWPASC